MPTLEEYVTFSLEDWQNVQKLKLLAQEFQTSQDPYSLKEFFEEYGVLNLVKFAIHWPAFEEIYRLEIFEAFWSQALDPLEVQNKQRESCYDIYKKQLIEMATQKTFIDGELAFNTPEEKFYFIAINCLIQQVRKGSREGDREELIELYLAMQQTVGYLGCLLLAEIYRQIAGVESTKIFTTKKPIGFFPFKETDSSLDPVVSMAIQQAYIHLYSAVELASLQKTQLPAAYLNEVENVIARLYEVKVNELPQIVKADLTFDLQQAAEDQAMQTSELLIKQLRLTDDINLSLAFAP